MDIKYLYLIFIIFSVLAILITIIRRHILFLESNKNRYESIIECSDSYIWDIDFYENRVFFSDNFKELLNINLYENIFSIEECKNLLSPYQYEILISIVKEIIINKEEKYKKEFDFYDKDGIRKMFLCRGKSIKSKDRGLIKVTGFLVDITKNREMEQRITYLAFHDSLTGVLNNTYVRQKLPKIIYSLDVNSFAALLIIDLNDFEDINDIFGYTVGDETVVRVAYFLRKVITQDDILCYLGVDKFLILLRSASNKEEVKKKIDSIIDRLKISFRIQGKEVYVNINIGAALYPQDGVNQQTLIKNAYTAIHYSKNIGENNYTFFNEKINKELLERVELERDLRHALENREFKLVYQPKVNVFTGEIEGMEALSRWVHPNKGIISPGKFIPISEENGMIRHIGKYVMKTAFEQNRTWQAKGFKPLRVAVNLSVKQLQQDDFLDIVESLLKESKLDPRWIEFEITESAIMKDFKRVCMVLSKLQSLGVYISLDDFGTGYSSLNYLKDLPINCIKIDKSFIDGIIKTDKEEFIAKSIIKLAHGINLKVVAEGVEKQEQFQILKKCGCDEIQGYFFSKPLNTSDFEKRIHLRYKI